MSAHGYTRRSFALADNLAFGDTATRDHFSDAVADHMRMALALEGPGTFASPRIDAARHEAGHAVFAAAHGRRVRSIGIFRLNEEAHAVLRRLGVAGDHWGGHTIWSDRDALHESTPDSDPQADLNAARHALAGFAGEWFDDETRLRFGSSADEITFAMMLVQNAGRKLGENAGGLFSKTLTEVTGTLRANREAHAALAARLMRKSTLNENALRPFLAHIVSPTPDPARGAE
jgi:hypothetical protein